MESEFPSSSDQSRQDWKALGIQKPQLQGLAIFLTLIDDEEEHPRLTYQTGVSYQDAVEIAANSRYRAFKWLPQEVAERVFQLRGNYIKTKGFRKCLGTCVETCARPGCFCINGKCTGQYW